MIAAASGDGAFLHLKLLIRARVIDLELGVRWLVTGPEGLR